MKIPHPRILSLTLTAAILSATSCTTGKVYTSWTSNASGFSYSIPETIVKIDIPVKFSRYGKKTDKGVFNPTDGIGYLELDNPTGPLVGFEFDGHPSALNVVVFDEANNTTSLDKFDVTYHVTGADATQRSTGIIKSVNSEASDKVAATIKNVTTTVGDVLKIAAGVSSLLQTTDDGVALETLLTDRIRVSLKLRSGYQTINAQIDEELNRIEKNISRLPTSKPTPLIVGIRGISLDGSCNAWPTKLSQAYIASKMDLGAQQTQEPTFVTKKDLNLANGIIYSDPQSTSFTLHIRVKPSDTEKEEPRKIRFSAQLPEAGKFRVLPLNPKFFATRNLTATFAPNGKLVSWGYKSTSRAEASSTFAKEEAALLNTITTEAITRRSTEETKDATTRANSAKLEIQIVAKENDLRLAQATVPVKESAYERAQAEYTAAKDDPAKSSTVNALKTAADAAELAVVTAKNSVITAQAELEALRAKRADVKAGLVSP